jgi:hypothetical protein
MPGHRVVHAFVMWPMGSPAPHERSIAEVVSDKLRLVVAVRRGVAEIGAQDREAGVHWIAPHVQYSHFGQCVHDEIRIREDRRQLLGHPLLARGSPARVSAELGGERPQVLAPEPGRGILVDVARKERSAA